MNEAIWFDENGEEIKNEIIEWKRKAELYDEIMAKRKAHAKKILAGKSKEWLHERAIKANNARWGKKEEK